MIGSTTNDVLPPGQEVRPPGEPRPAVGLDRGRVSGTRHPLAGRRSRRPRQSAGVLGAAVPLAALLAVGCGAASGIVPSSRHGAELFREEARDTPVLVEADARAAITGDALLGERAVAPGAAAGSESPPAAARPLLAEATARPPESGAGAASNDAGSAVAATDAPQQQGPLLIYEAEINLAVHEVRDRIAAVVAVSDDLGGFLQSQNDSSVIIRVPAARFRDALSRVEALGDILHRRVSALDVSDEVRDVRIRLRNAVEMRDRLAELLARAETVPDSLTIERELERLTQTIEQLRGVLRGLEDRITYSTITVRFQPIRVDQQVPRERFRLPFPWLDELGLVNLLRLQP